MKILIALPVYKTIHAKTAFSLIEMMKVTPHELQTLFQDGIFIHQNQNLIAEYAVENKFDYVFYVEHDMVFEPETLNKLLADEKDIICANYNFRSEPRQSMVFRRTITGELEHIPQRELPKRTFPCAVVPTGLTLIKTEVFKKLARPYFFHEYTFDGVLKSSQDVYFCEKATAAGYEIWCNPTVETGHIGEQIY